MNPTLNIEKPGYDKKEQYYEEIKKEPNKILHYLGNSFNIIDNSIYAIDVFKERKQALVCPEEFANSKIKKHIDRIKAQKDQVLGIINHLINNEFEETKVVNKQKLRTLKEMIEKSDNSKEDFKKIEDFYKKNIQSHYLNKTHEKNIKN